MFLLIVAMGISTLLEIHNTKLQSIFNDWFNFHIDPIKTDKGKTVKKLIENDYVVQKKKLSRDASRP